MNYYNEYDKSAAEWIKCLIDAGEIPAGHVDTRNIEDVLPSELAGYQQCHFFAGIAGWPLALKLAGWPQDKPVWTGSCPCQPFSQAGNRLGTEDKRHLWPVWMRLISDCKPNHIFGEQVSSAINLGATDEEVFCLLNHETPGRIQEICGEIKGWSKASVRSMSKRVRAEMAFSIKGLSEKSTTKTQIKKPNLQDQIYRKMQGELFGFSNSVEVSAIKNSVRSRSIHARYISQDFSIKMRDFWSSIEGRTWQARLQQRINRSNNSIERICVQKHKSSLFCNECGHGELGAGKIERNHIDLEGLLDELRGVAKKTGSLFDGKVFHGWLDTVYDDLQNSGYACASAIIPAASVGAPHLRERVWFVGNLADASTIGHCERLTESGNKSRWQGSRATSVRCSNIDDWRYCEWLDCIDNKRRPTQPGLSPLAHGIPDSLEPIIAEFQSMGIDAANAKQLTKHASEFLRGARSFRSGQIRGYGNAIVPQVAAEFIIASGL